MMCVQIKCVLLKLLQHNVLDIVPLAASGKPSANAQPVVAYKVRCLHLLPACICHGYWTGN